jgi:hypothetical protein
MAASALSAPANTCSTAVAAAAAAATRIQHAWLRQESPKQLQTSYWNYREPRAPHSHDSSYKERLVPDFTGANHAYGLAQRLHEAPGEAAT